MTRREEIELAWFNKAVQSNHRYDEKTFREAVEWADKTMIEKAFEYAKARYDLDYCGNVRDVLDYLKSLVEE
jgi:hypothetical protein